MSETCFIISDVLSKENFQFVTAYWDGETLVEDLSLALTYRTLETAESCLKKGNFYDPVIYEIEKRAEGSSIINKIEVINILGRFDMVNKYGKAGGK